MEKQYLCSVERINPTTERSKQHRPTNYSSSGEELYFLRQPTLLSPRSRLYFLRQPTLLSPRNRLYFLRQPATSSANRLYFPTNRLPGNLPGRENQLYQLIS
ncbi:MAG: hypothetical protein IKO85_10545 [Bacteroidaceae bacterium]|nr:hypothetical protein [Bacteroidaceae bacterium]